jgi:uncharacterized secreted protein with C-terminal beta-propeller domain
MKGEPALSTLAAESRLAKSTCDASTNETLAAHVRAMRVEVDQRFQEWHDGQQGCWAQMREDYIERKRLEEELAKGGYGYGMGLYGVGEGGGGRGEGIGLGMVGTIGHGAGHAAMADVVRGARKASGTNNQVATVDEADLVKTDGKYVYLAAGGALRIVEAMNPKVLSVTKVLGTAREMFVEGDRAVVYSSIGSIGVPCTYGYDCQFGGDGSRTRVSVFDVQNRAEPRLVRAFELSGSLVAARRIGKTVHTVVADNDSPIPSYETWPGDLPMCGTPEDKVRAKFAALKAANERVIRANGVNLPTLIERGQARTLCSALLRPSIHDGEAFTSVVSFDLGDDAAPPAFASLESRPGAVFASESSLYVAVTHRKEPAGGAARHWFSYAPAAHEITEIHKFHIGSTPKETRYVGSGTVPGHVLNQFAMDEWYGYLRVATTKGHVPEPGVESVVSILAETGAGDRSALARIGAIEKIAPGEDIRSVRFDGDRGYVVTFKKTDPLFVMDLFQPTHPRILGELKIPGFSTYMHRIDPDHLLSIGFDANDHGSFAYFDGVILQLFDVKNATDPKLVHKEKIGTRGSSSQAATDHLAFNYFADEALLAVPMTVCEGGGDGQNGDRVAASGLFVYDVDVDRGFTRLGVVDHARKDVSCSTWWSQATSAVKRSVFLDDLVYSIASDRVKVQNMNHFGVDLADFPLEP